MYKLFLVLFVIVSIILIGLIILQNNNTVDIGSSMNNSRSFFNTNTPNKIITKLIFVLAIVFFMISLILSNLNNHRKNVVTDNYINYKK
ncbi:preprotein translocase subunit SecG [Enterobacteriaceae endosymbiont of Plateumaris pusilla]|uniref:preprotein translocase subunit SecG n=1 Tax=Enterobacteriaceae endosymbiont of Plateumaris pusilla TaxID=2675795 RepID=UPI00144952BB|nr:preprotein translocase subunit SecG [Enterobacteriaceae endosymbiont of Plateumaris pusilla]QJC29610.1 preprotein translocase subunit SecG [Enterobacteriaceae endosymbiont of Plateumaris pusilla]